MLDLIVVTFPFRFADEPVSLFGGYGCPFLCGGAAVLALWLKIVGDTSLIRAPLPPSLADGLARWMARRSRAS